MTGPDPTADPLDPTTVAAPAPLELSARDWALVGFVVENAPRRELPAEQRASRDNILRKLIGARGQLRASGGARTSIQLTEAERAFAEEQFAAAGRHDFTPEDGAAVAALLERLRPRP